jgi:hypothetical protein
MDKKFRSVFVELLKREKKEGRKKRRQGGKRGEVGTEEKNCNYNEFRDLKVSSVVECLLG